MTPAPLGAQQSVRWLKPDDPAAAPPVPENPHCLIAQGSKEPVASQIGSASGFTVKLRDGGGICSDGDWCTPRDPDLAADLRQVWWSRIMDLGLVPRLREHVLTCARTPLLSDEEIQVLRSDLRSFFKKARVCMQRDNC